MSAFDKLKTNVEAEDNGQVFRHPEFPELWCKVRSDRYPAYQDALNAAQRRLARHYGEGLVPSEVSRKETGKLMVRHLLVDIGDDGAKKVEVDEALRERIATDRAYAPMRDWLFRCVRRVGQIDTEAEKADAGNSATSPAGKGGGGRT